MSGAESSRLLVLVSVSPRRRRLLTEAGFAHEALAPGIDDGELVPPHGVTPRHWTAALSYLKARAGRSRAPRDSEPGTVTLAADTIVVKGDRIIGQPRNRDDARRILATLSGSAHEVITGVTLLQGDRRLFFTDSARVQVGPLTDSMIAPYLDSDDWRGKAGAYNLLERIDAGWPITYHGDPTTIMGLPMSALTPLLRRLLGPSAQESIA